MPIHQARIINGSTFLTFFFSTCEHFFLVPNFAMFCLKMINTSSVIWNTKIVRKKAWEIHVKKYKTRISGNINNISSTSLSKLSFLPHLVKYQCRFLLIDRPNISKQGDLKNTRKCFYRNSWFRQHSYHMQISNVSIRCKVRFLNNAQELSYASCFECTNIPKTGLHHCKSTKKKNKWRNNVRERNK